MHILNGRMSFWSKMVTIVKMYVLASSVSRCFAWTTTQCKCLHSTFRWSEGCVVPRISSVTRTRASSTALSSKSKASSSSLVWMREGLLLSSFSDGLVNHPAAINCLQRGLTRIVWERRRALVEANVAASVMSSPCNGPDPTSLEQLESVDKVLEQQQKHKNENDDNKDNNIPLPDAVRILYIPTALYALRPGSNNTPGKQRQRARADGKKRRNELVQLVHHCMTSSSLSSSLSSSSMVSVVTLDVMDGSVKQAEVTVSYGSTEKEDAETATMLAHERDSLPQTGVDAMEGWQPHLVYVAGGNTFWLHHCIDDNAAVDWSRLLRSLVCSDTGAFYCGASAGAIVAGASMEPACWKEWDDPSVVPDRERYEDWTGVAGLGLTGSMAWFPHHVHDTWSAVVEAKGSDLADRADVDVQCLRDDQVCHVDGTSQAIHVYTAVP